MHLQLTTLVALAGVATACSIPTATPVGTQARAQSPGDAVLLLGEDGAPGATGPAGTSGTGMPVCAFGQVAKWNGAVWSCGADDQNAGGNGLIASVTVGSGLSGGAQNGAALVGLTTACADDEILRSTGAGYQCSSDETAITPTNTGPFGGSGNFPLLILGQTATNGNTTGLALSANTTGPGGAPAMLATTSTQGVRALRVDGTAGTRMPLVIRDPDNERVRVAMTTTANNPNGERWNFHAEFQGSDLFRISYWDGSGFDDEALRVATTGLVRFDELQIGAQRFDNGGGAGTLHGSFTIGMRTDGVTTCRMLCQTHGFTDCASGGLRIDDSGALSAATCTPAAAVNGFVLCSCGY